MNRWKCTLELDEKRNVTSGRTAALADAIRRGADLRVCTTFNYEEHMGPGDERQGRVDESIDFRVTYLIDDAWTAGVTTLRFPADCSLKFQPHPSLSFFLYNQDGHQAIARPFLTDRGAVTPENSGEKVGQIAPRYYVDSNHDDDTRSPSSNFVYSFGYFRYCVRDDWTELLSHDADGNVLSGSYQALGDAARRGRSLKVGVRDLCAGLGDTDLAHEVFAELGSIYDHVDRGFIGGESLPLVRVAPAVPLRYASGNWSFGWILPRSDGQVAHEIIDPYTRAFSQTFTRNAARWFVR